jgi:thymidylate synthase ThyX
MPPKAKASLISAWRREVARLLGSDNSARVRFGMTMRNRSLMDSLRRADVAMARLAQRR